MQANNLDHVGRQHADPHAAQPVLHIGSPIDKARIGVVMLHGRGAGAEDMLSLAEELDLEGVAYLAPQAAGNSWYPERFLVETRLNEPFLTSALNKISAILHLLDEAGLAMEETALIGFSQGACLALEYTARNARHFAAVIGLSGGLIGGEHERRSDSGSLANTPVFLGCSDIDPHIPLARVLRASAFFESLGGRVTTRIYRGMGHTINSDELDMIRVMLG